LDELDQAIEVRLLIVVHRHVRAVRAQQEAAAFQFVAYGSKTLL
jgi:hypothetical protein